MIDNWYKNDENLTPCVVREDENCISLGQACTGKTTLSRFESSFIIEIIQPLTSNNSSWNLTGLWDI